MSDSDFVRARWLGGRVQIPALGLEVQHGDEVDGIPRGEAEQSVYWEIVTKAKKPKESD